MKKEKVKKGKFLKGKSLKGRNLKGKKIETKTTKIHGKNTEKNQTKFIEGIYSGGDGNFGFIDIEGQEKGFFVYGNKKAGAKDGDKVKAELVDFNGRKEAVVVKIFEIEKEVIIGKYRDNEKFGFVIPKDNKNSDIFIAGSRKKGAVNGDTVEVKIIKRGGKNPEGVITRIINEKKEN